MKRFLSCAVLALGAAALLGLAGARADGPNPLPKGPVSGVPVVTSPTAAGAPAAAATPAAPVVTAPPVVSAGCCPAACCTAPCETPLKKVCVGETATRTKTTRVYGEACEDFCLPKCSSSLFSGLLGGHGHGDCGDCGACATGGCASGGCSSGGCTDCEHHARVRKYLVVKIKSEEECYNKCHVEYQPEEAKCHGHSEPLFHKKGCDKGCDAGCCGTVVLPPASAPVMPPADGGEKLPLPKDK